MVAMITRNPMTNGRFYRVSPFVREFQNRGSDLQAGEMSFRRQPSVNILESESGYSIEIAAPGLKKELFDIKAFKGLLTVRAKVEQELKGDIRRREFDYSNFSRTFRLNDEIDTNAISASYEAGILTINLPKSTTAQNKKIEIK